MGFLSPAQYVSRYRALSARGILGMNRRNHCYISRYNSRDLFPTVDNKLLTKKLALEFNLTTPELIGVIDNQHDVRNLAQLLSSYKGFCIKPAKGSGGKGILVITHSEDGRYQRSNGEWMSIDEIGRHVSNILAGLFSLGGATDSAMVESLLVPSHSLERYSYQGVPDIRVIVFRGVPVMAMVRLACASSQGKANLHQGAIGVGLDIKTGMAVHAVQKEHHVQVHPDTGAELSELRIPNWPELLELACRCYEITSLGYLGVDLVLDEHVGPTLLELNARPGLSIQIANNAGLIPRLKLVETIKRPELMPIKERILFATKHF